MSSQAINVHSTDSLRAGSERQVLRGLVQNPLDAWPPASVLRATDFVHYKDAFEVLAFLIISYLRDGRRPFMSQAALSADEGIGAALAAELFETAHHSAYSKGLQTILNRPLTNSELMRIGKVANRCEQIAEDSVGIGNESGGIDFEIIDSATFAETDYNTNFAIEGIMTEGQPQLYGGPSKSLKTSVMLDQFLSLAAKVPFLGRFAVPKAKRCLLLSSESGCATLKETALRICDAKGINLADLGDQMQWGFRPPQLNASNHIATLEHIILRERIDVIGIDPAYLSMNLAGNDASNQFAVGAVLMNLTRLQSDTGATPILATHFRMHMQLGTMPTLEHVAGAGFGQWARQWMLLNRREAFNDENPGNHQLLMTFGGSAGHAGGYALDIEEGLIQDGRIWQVSVSRLSEIREKLENDREERKRHHANVTHENHRVAILRSMKRFPRGESMSTIRDLTGISGRYFRPVWEDLLSSQEIEQCEFEKGKAKKDGTPKTYPGCRIVDPVSRLSKQDSDTSDTLGHTRTLSDTVRPV